MLGPTMEDDGEQARDKDIDPPLRGRGMEDKSSDTIASMEAILIEVKIAMVDPWEVVDLLEQGMEKGLDDLREEN